MATPVEHKPSLISWNLTKKCNLRCPHVPLFGPTYRIEDVAFTFRSDRSRLGLENP